MLFSESRYDFQRCLWPDIWDLIKADANPKVGCQSSQISGHCVASGVNHPHIGFQKKTCPSYDAIAGDI